MQIIIKLIILVGLIFFLKFIYQESDYNKYVDETFLYQTDSSFINSWQPQHTQYLRNEIAEAELISENDMGILQTDSSISKIKKIGFYLLRKLYHIHENPKDEVFAMTPLQQFKTISAGKSGLYCTQYSAMFTFFCRANGLITRQIESVGVNDRHIVNETFLPETKEWVFTDLTNNIVTTKSGVKNLNLLEVYNSLTNASKTKEFQVLQFHDSILEFTSFENVSKILNFDYDSLCKFHFYYEMNFDWVYSNSERRKRFFLNEIWYVSYSNNPTQETWFYLKNGSFVLIVLILLSFLIPRKKSQKSTL